MTLVDKKHEMKMLKTPQIMVKVKSTNYELVNQNIIT